jgi:O-glycosyl hydrolase
MKIFSKLILILIPVLLIFTGKVNGQTEVEPWGNITGIRRHGQLFKFESSLRIIGGDGKQAGETAKERQRPHYARAGQKQIITTNMDSLFFTETVKDACWHKAKVKVKTQPQADGHYQGVYFCITLPAEEYEGTKLLFKGPSAGRQAADIAQFDGKEIKATGVDITSEHHDLTIRFHRSIAVLVKKDTFRGRNDYLLYLPVIQGAAHSGQPVTKKFTIKASGDIDRSPVEIKLNTAQKGSPFDGFGGNFRLQNPKTDPEVIDYCLDHLRVAWGRVELPWRFWQPLMEANPTDSAKAGKLNPAVTRAMEMAQRLNRKGMPVILSAWAPPAWAVVGKPNFSPVNGVWGNPLDPAHMDQIYKSITDYILYLKENYGVEVSLFSFNESDLGINIRLTAEEHDALIKGLGAYFVSKGLHTKMLLGDNSDATTIKFIYPALNDPDAKPYIGAISFHSWRGWGSSLLQQWADAARQINVPLIVGEGSIDAAAWNYPQIFEESTYAREEINLYTRLMAICQPISILQWQLTADYSPLIGGGIFGNNEPLHPGQRFWNLKQLASTPPHLFAMPVSCSNADISCAAVGDNEKNAYAIHLVNNGAAREVTVSGLPQNIRMVHAYVTDKKQAMKELSKITTANGTVKLELPETSFVTLIAGK